MYLHCVKNVLSLENIGINWELAKKSVNEKRTNGGHVH